MAHLNQWPSDYLAGIPRRRLLTAAAVLMLLWLAVSFLSPGKIKPGLLQARVDRVPNRAFGVVLSEKIPLRREVIGTIQSRFPVEAASRVAARVVKVNVRSGDRVKAGQVLVELDTSDLNAQLAQAQGELTAAQAELKRTTADERRFSALFARGSVTARERDGAEAAYRSAAARVSQSQAALAAARSAFNYAIVRSPVSGVVVERMVEAGDMAMPGKPLVRLYDETALRAELQVPEEMRGEIAVGTPLELQIADSPYHTRVDEIVPAADPGSRSFTVRADLPSGQHLTPGMFVRATFAAGTTEVLTIPRQAVQEIGQLHTVRVYQDGRIENRMVSLGRPMRDRVEVLAGLRAGERVILADAEPVAR